MSKVTASLGLVWMLQILACGDVQRPCRGDDECTDGEVCAFDRCELVSCNVDADCSGRACVDGLCAPGLLLGDGGDDVIAAPAPSVEVEEEDEDEEPAGPWNPYEPECGAVTFEPAAGSVEVSPLAEILVRFPDADAMSNASLALAGDVPVARVDDGLTAALIPLVALSPGASYTVEVTTDCGLDTASFTVRSETRSFTDVSASFRLQDATIIPSATGNLFAMMNVDPLLVSLGAPGGLIGYEDNDGDQQKCEATVSLAPFTADTRPDAVWNGEGHVEGYVPSASGLRQIHTRVQRTETGVEVAAFVVADARMLAHFILPDCREGHSSFPGCAQLACQLAAPTLSCKPCEDGFPTCLTYAVHATAEPAPAPLAITREAVCARNACADEPECL